MLDLLSKENVMSRWSRFSVVFGMVGMVFLSGYMVGRTNRGESNSEEIRISGREALVFAPTPDGSRTRHSLKVKRAVVPGSTPVEYEPVSIGESGGLVIEPGEWVVVVDGRTYLLAPVK